MTDTVYLLKVLLVAICAGWLLYVLGVRVVHAHRLHRAPRPEPPAIMPRGESLRPRLPRRGEARAASFNPSNRTAIKRRSA
jgi:hypothetical protein